MSVVFEKNLQNILYTFDDILMPQPHMHKSIEMIYVIEGESYAYINKREYLLKAGDVFITFPYQIHRYKTVTSGKFLITVFSPEIFFKVSKFFYNTQPETNQIHDEHLSYLIKNLIDADKSFFHNNIVIGHLNIIIPYILSHTKLIPYTDIKFTYFNEIINFCNEHYTEKLTLDIVSKGVNISKYRISNILNRVLDMSFTDYVNTLRVMAACDLLKNDDYSISYISEEVGFGSIRAFNRAFKLIMDSTPTIYRKK